MKKKHIVHNLDVDRQVVSSLREQFFICFRTHCSFFSAECNSLWPAFGLLFQKCDILHVNYILLKRKSPSNTLRRTRLMTGCMFGPIVLLQSKPRTNQVPGIKSPATLCITDAFEHFANPESAPKDHRGQSS